jgi:hypothetical protein
MIIYSSDVYVKCGSLGLINWATKKTHFSAK